MGQVAPAGIVLLDQLDFPAAMPILQLFFPRNRFLRRCERFDMNQQVHAIFFDEFGTSAAAVLLEPSSKVTGDADVERPVWLAGENVDPLRCAHGSAPTREISNAAPWVPAFAGTTA
jgi:hypothetical protein